MRRTLAIALVVAFAGPVAAGPQVDYMLQCQGCHLSDGTGTPGAVPSFVDFVGTFLASPEGREFLVRVPGSSQSSLDHARLAAVLNWILTRFDPGSLGDDFVPFTDEEVARVRRPPLTDVETLRRELLSRVDASARSTSVTQDSGTQAPEGRARRAPARETLAGGEGEARAAGERSGVVRASPGPGPPD